MLSSSSSSYILCLVLLAWSSSALLPLNVAPHSSHVSRLDATGPATALGDVKSPSFELFEPVELMKLLMSARVSLEPVVSAASSAAFLLLGPVFFFTTGLDVEPVAPKHLNNNKESTTVFSQEKSTAL